MQREVNSIVAKSLQKAYNHDRTGNVGKAYAYYTVVAELCPTLRLDIEEAFVDVLCQWGMQLAYENRFSDIVLCYTRSLDIYPNNPRMLNNFAAHLLRNNDPITAIKYLKRALQANPNFLPAERNLQNAFSMAVDRWHFPMLNDKQRNSAFESVIQKKISQGYDTILDIGTGTGLLSLYAHDAGAEKVYACEYSVAMIKIAQKVFESNNAKNIILLPKFSTDLAIPADITERVKLIVTETFDAGLFGEHVIPSLLSAHTNILHKDGIVIPMSATLYVAAVQCEYIRNKSSVVFDEVQNSCPLNFDNMSILLDDEYYDTEYLKNVKVNYITEPKVLFTVNFNDISDLQKFNVDGVKSSVNVKCEYDGTIDKFNNYQNIKSSFNNKNSYGIAQHINEFKIKQIFDLNSSLYLYEPLSNINILTEIKESEIAEQIVNFGKIYATTNRPLPNALICWYKIKLTLNHNYDTKRNGSFMNHTAILLEEELKNIVLQGNDVCIKVQQAESMIHIKVK
ncbi:Putative protein arginine N-methyltransferase 10 [Dufourea novaeangliae]|uniref:Uncharacterized protein n=1 Tax=Dufourea novaeangliae TaxID=178035 RepID=A0A154PSF4_DUFNO|nr:Putative protein arginine N-methyltransferase 10 [Dufourea novaeangliae]